MPFVFVLLNFSINFIASVILWTLGFILYRYLDIIEEESLRLSQMATNVLDLTKVENQTILTNVSTFNLSEQIRDCLLLPEKRWSEKKDRDRHKFRRIRNFRE